MQLSKYNNYSVIFFVLFEITKSICITIFNQ